MEEKALLQKIACGDEASFVYLLDKYENRVFRYFHRCFNDDYIAEDLTQNVFIIILQKLRDGHMQWQFFSRYLFKMCKNIALKEFRHKRQSKFIQEKSSLEMVVAPAPKKEKSLLVNEAIAALPWVQKQVILFKFVERFSLKEIAEILEMPINTVKSHIHRAKKELQKTLGDYYEH